MPNDEELQNVLVDLPVSETLSVERSMEHSMERRMDGSKGGSSLATARHGSVPPVAQQTEPSVDPALVSRHASVAPVRAHACETSIVPCASEVSSWSLF